MLHLAGFDILINLTDLQCVSLRGSMDIMYAKL